MRTGKLSIQAGLGAALLAAIIAGCGGGGPGFVVTAMSPASGTVLTQAPAEVVLTFSADVDAAAFDESCVRILGSGGDGTFDDGNEVLIEPASVTVTSARDVRATFTSTLPADTYRVVAVGRDAGTALDFDGTDDVVRVPGDPTFAPGTGDWTVECWVAVDDVTRANVPVTCADFDFGNGWRLIQEQPSPINGSFYFIVEGEVPGDDIAAIGGAVPQPGAWQHVAGSYDAAAGEIRLYINGELATTFTGAAVSAITPSADLFFCRYNQTSASTMHYLDGRLDEVRLWDRARTALEIKRDYRRVLTGSEPGLVGYWTFDADSGQSVRDTSPMGNDGTLGEDAQAAGDEPARIASTAWPTVRDATGRRLGGGRDYVGTFTVQ